MKRYLMAALLCCAALPLIAQPAEWGGFRVYRNEIQLQAFRFENFFQARGGRPEQSVNAIGVEYGFAYKRDPNAADIFGAVFATNYNNTGTPTSFGGRIGLARYGSVHSFYGYVERLENGYSFETEETTTNANLTAVLASYSYRFSPQWQAGLNTYNEAGRFDEPTGFESNYHQIEGEVRYRGFGRKFEPRVGYAIGGQDVRNDVDSYDYSHWFVQVGTQINPRIELSARYRDRSREYRNIDRSEDRGQVQLRAVFRHNERLATTARFTYEESDSPQPGRDFDTTRFFAGIAYGF